MSQKYTNAMMSALQSAQTEAHQREHQNLTPEHLLYAFVSESAEEETSIGSLLSLSGVTLQALKAALENRIKTFPKVLSSSGQLYPAPEFQKLMALSEGEAKKLQDEYVAPEHFILALLQGSASGFESAKLLKDMGVTDAKFRDSLKKVRGNTRIQDEDPESKMNVLKKYCRDLTALAREQKLDPVIGRDEEIRRVMQVLSRRTKNNPVLIGVSAHQKHQHIKNISTFPDSYRDYKSQTRVRLLWIMFLILRINAMWMYTISGEPSVMKDA